MVNIPAISIRQPWAELILLGKKTIELRSWAPDYRGQLWLHAAQKGTPELESRFGLSDLFKGGYIGSIFLKAVVLMDPERWQSWQPRHLDLGPFKPGLYGWVLSSPRRLEKPIPGPGKLYLFYPPPEIGTLLQMAKYSE